MPAINFPPLQIASDYTADSPWTDDYGQQWAFNPVKSRWTPVPSANTGGGSVATGVKVVSLAEPLDKVNGMEWFRLVDGVTYTYYKADGETVGYWVADDSAPAPDLADVWAALDTKLSEVTEPITITDASINMNVTHANGYLRFTSTAATKNYTVVSTDGMAVGSTVTLRNAAVTGNLVIGASLNVTITGETASFTVPPLGTAQLVKVAANTWDLI